MLEMVRHLLGWRKRRRHLQQMRENQAAQAEEVINLLREAYDDDEDQMKRPSVLERIRKPRAP